MSFRSFGFHCVVALLAFLQPALDRADEVPVRFVEGLTRGFLAVSNADGRKIGEGDSQQVARGDRLTNYLTIHFNDGSVFEEETTFSQRRAFHLLSDHVVQKGPSFKAPLETLIDTATGQVTVHSTDDKGKQKSLTRHMELPADLANGLLFIVVKDMDPRAPGVTLSYLAATPEPRLVKLVFKPQPADVFMVGSARLKAEHYVVSVNIGGAAGVVAPLVGKKPADIDIWVIGGKAPTFAAFRGPLSEGGPVWRINLISPELPSR